MLPQDIQVLEQQHKRIRMFLTLGVQPCLLRLFEAEWREAETWDEKARVVCRWLGIITEHEVWLFGGLDDAVDA